MRRIQSGQGATDLGSAEAVVLVPGQPGIVEVVQEIDNLRACVAEVREWAEKDPGIHGERLLGILHRYGLR